MPSAKRSDPVRSSPHSMTAFARETGQIDAGELTWELRSVNHRYLEPVLRLPEELRGLEPAVREQLGNRLARGKLDCTLRFAPAAGAGGSMRVDTRLLEQVLAAADVVAKRIGEPATPRLMDLLRWPGLLQEPPPDLDQVASAALALLEQAIATLTAVRAREGGRLRTLIIERCDRLQALVVVVRERMPEVLASVRTRLVDRLGELREQLDPTRLEQEMALLAQRLDVDEELDRLEAHLAEVGKVLDQGGPVGRRLDFLMQELNREANTLTSKSGDVEVTRQAVEMKVLIEQMREQIQNLE